MTTETSYALTRPAYVGQSHLVATDLPLVSSFYPVHARPHGDREGAERRGARREPAATPDADDGQQGADRAAQCGSPFDTAFLMPNRTRDLPAGRAMRPITTSALDGASDHLVERSHSISPIPKATASRSTPTGPEHEAWNFHQDGQVETATIRLDLQALYVQCARGRLGGGARPTARAIGHIHLQVGDIPQADALRSRRPRPEADGALSRRAASSATGG